MSFSSLSRRAREARAWMLDACFPLWANTGVSGNLFAETLDLQHKPADHAITRVRVQARQTYVFSLAARMGWQPETALGLVGMGVNMLTGAARREDGLVGRTLDVASGHLSDDTPDLYDTAFALYALGSAASVLSGPGEALSAAQDILKSVDAKQKDQTHGGYHEVLPPPSMRLQNPHMHLLEACLALNATDRAGSHLDRAGEIIGLFHAHLTQPDGLLGERFKPDWSMLDGDAHDIIEPGHQFEWVWLLSQHAKATGGHGHPEAERLYAFALSTLDEGGRAIMEVRRDGSPVDASRRTWSQTEALKAHLAMLETTGREDFAFAAANTFDILMDEFLTPDGGWIDHYSAEGQVLATDMPASTGYHVLLAFDELIRIAGA